MSGAPPDAAALAAVLTRAAGVEVTVDRIAALTGGASSATFAVDAVRGGAAWPLIVQRAAGAAAITKATQAAVQRLGGEHGLPVADVVAVFGDGDGLGDGFAMARIEGETLAPRWLRDAAFTEAREVLTGQCAAALAKLHAVPLGEVPALPGGSGAAQLAEGFAAYRGFGVDLPVFDLAFAWLRARMDDAAPTALVHGDFRSGNFVVGPEGLRAVLDWELVHLGDPLEDLAWLCVQAWRFGHWQHAVGGFGERAELYAAYEAAGGARVDRERAHLLEVWGTLRWGLACLQLADDHLSGRVRSVERAVIGRRVTEVAADLLHLIRHGDI